jgi:hypothetical protein
MNHFESTENDQPSGAVNATFRELWQVLVCT